MLEPANQPSSQESSSKFLFLSTTHLAAIRSPSQLADCVSVACSGEIDCTTLSTRLDFLRREEATAQQERARRHFDAFIHGLEALLRHARSPDTLAFLALTCHSSGGKMTAPDDVIFAMRKLSGELRGALDSIYGAEQGDGVAAHLQRSQGLVDRLARALDVYLQQMEEIAAG